MKIGHNRGPLRKYRYAAFKQTFEEQQDGSVLVTTDDGLRGRFHADGRFIEGDLTQANKHMLLLTGGPRLPEAFRYRWGEVPISIDRRSGWPEEYDKLLSHQIG